MQRLAKICWASRLLRKNLDALDDFERAFEEGSCCSGLPGSLSARDHADGGFFGPEQSHAFESFFS